jgi:radical SAM superfamily enzyme YgiQ (UPF0313 family)
MRDMADILLATSYYLQFDPKQQRILKPYPPLATLYAAAVLRRAGYSVALFDAMFAPGEAAFEAALEAHRPAIVALYEDSFNWLNKMCLGRMRQAVLAMADAARRRGAKVIASGPDATDVPDIYLEHVDQVILGEGERTLEALCALHARAASPDELRAVPGLAVIDPDGAVVRTPPRALIDDLDSLPRAAWDLVDIEAYRRTWRRRHGYFSLNQITTRGCPFRCNWCAKPVYGDAYHTRSPEHLVDELRWMKETLRPDHLWYADDILGLKKSWLKRFAELAGQADVAIPFTCQTRVDLMTDGNVDALRRAGCREAWLGVESGAQRVLDAMEKGTTLAQIHHAADRLKAAGIRVAFFIQLGYPGEGWDEIAMTRALIATCMPDEIGISVAYPLPGTRFYDRVAARVQDKTRWDHSGDLDPLFPGAFPREFYQRLHEMMHGEFQSRHGLNALRELVRRPARLSREELERAAKLPLHLGRFAVRRAQLELDRRRLRG